MLDKLKNLIGGNSNGFFLEFNEDDNQSTQTQEETAPKEAAKQPEPVAEAKEEAKQPEPVAEAKEAATKSKKTSIKDKKKESTEKTTTTSASPSVPSGGASSWEQPFWVKVMYQNNGSSNGKLEKAEKTFSTDNLLPTPSKSRRRPGPSLNKFKEMARQTKRNSNI